MDDAPSAPATVPSLTVQELAARITELAGHMNAANRRWLALIAEFDRRKGWSDGFTPSCAHWLNWKCGLDLFRDAGSAIPARAGGRGTVA